MNARTESVMVDAKPWWESRTILANLITLGSIVVMVLGLIADNAAGLGIDDRTKLWIGIAVGGINAAINLYLRPGTTTPVAMTRGQHREVIAHVPEPSPATNAPREWRDL